MTSWLDTLNDAWDELARTAPVSRQYRSKLISKDVTLEIRAGIRATDSAPCLMLQTPLAPDAQFELSGMRLSSVPDDTGPLLVLSLEDSSRRDLFSTICADVVAAAALADRTEALDQFLARLGAWRHFLRDRRIGLSRNETVGLLGELLVLAELLQAWPTALDCWKSPEDGLHDFEYNGHALETKTSLGPAARIRISGLDQLDNSGLRRLDLIHVRLIEAPAGTTLDSVIERIKGLLRSGASVRDFENGLLRRGLMPDDTAARTTPRVQLRTIDSYNVDVGFPRLERADLPQAITEAEYSLDIRALSLFGAVTAEVLRLFQSDAVP